MTQEKIRTVLQAYNSVTVYTFGLGAFHDTALLFDLANTTNGCYYHIKDTDDIAPAFADCLVTLKNITCQAVTLHIDTENASTLTALHTRDFVDQPHLQTSVSLHPSTLCHPCPQGVTEATVRLGNLK